VEADLPKGTISHWFVPDTTQANLEPPRNPKKAGGQYSTIDNQDEMLAAVHGLEW
jgi:hypothetical protein